MNKVIFCFVLASILLEVAGCSNKPDEVGVFIKTENGWEKLQPYKWQAKSVARVPHIDTYVGYVGTESLSISNLPTVYEASIILVNNIPLDPTKLFWGRNAGPKDDISVFEPVSGIARYKNQKYQGRWGTDLDSQPVVCKTTSDGDLEISTEVLLPGTYALIYQEDLTGLNYTAYFFNISVEANKEDSGEEDIFTHEQLANVLLESFKQDNFEKFYEYSFKKEDWESLYDQSSGQKKDNYKFIIDNFDEELHKKEIKKMYDKIMKKNIDWTSMELTNLTYKTEMGDFELANIKATFSNKNENVRLEIGAGKLKKGWVFQWIK